MTFVSRFNPKPGWMDFWNEIRKPNPYRWPILAVSVLPLCLIGYWLNDQTFYAAPEKPEITYITTFDPNRSDEEIIASNIANQEVKELRQAQEEKLARRKRDIYKALGAATGMDVDEIERRADARRAAEEAEKQAQIDEVTRRQAAMANDQNSDNAGEGSGEDTPPDGSATPGNSEEG